MLRTAFKRCLTEKKYCCSSDTEANKKKRRKQTKKKTTVHLCLFVICFVAVFLWYLKRQITWFCLGLNAVQSWWCPGLVWCSLDYNPVRAYKTVHIVLVWVVAVATCSSIFTTAWANSSEQRLHRRLLFATAYRCFTKGRWNHVSETQKEKKNQLRCCWDERVVGKGWEKGVKCKWSWKISWFDSSSCFLCSTRSSLNICRVRLAKRRDESRGKQDRDSRLLKISAPEFLL